ncbi:nodulation protein NodH [Xinfangfangia sp. D13-10-4-6]|uniref:nodulation protein NodH n=1 Tax=Pseudogemmobacter hezensis TaxID=2737662 RepID=UPI001555FD00|nr:nodulation protein NodH [Pseudogemmobacter hezensis]NPD14162.1 nodulation protein NodH [Pseudogemmobacter hezensis]
MPDVKSAARPRFTSFVMLAEMRTGSNFLEANLNCFDGITCHGEMFNPHFIGGQKSHEMFGFDLAAREKDPLGLLRAMRAQTPGLSGFRYFHDHDQRILPVVMDDPQCAKIILTRNPLESYVSWQIARETNQWRLTNIKNLKSARIRFDAGDFETHLQTSQEHQIHLLHLLQTSGQTAFYLDYEDIRDVDVLNGLAAWLGSEARIEAVDDRLKKQNPGPIAAKVTNPEEMEAALSQLDRFNLGRSPNFEPRRNAAVPSFLAAKTAPLLFLPVKGGPVEAVSAWLAAPWQGTRAADAGLIGDFGRKSLREWQEAHPGYRSFTVLRHPLLRAHQAFLTLIVSGRLNEHRNALIRAHDAPLPGKGRAFADIDQHRSAFLAFLRYAKLSLSAQTGLRVDPHWASQSAVLQGFGNLLFPDLLLREDDLARGLGFLAAGFGEAPAPVSIDPAPAAALDEIWTPELEEAARDAWARDYTAFGFAPWRG